MRALRRLGFLLITLISCASCQQSVHVIVRDGETGKPIEAAHAELSYEHNPPFFVAPRNVVGSTGADGTVDLSGATGAMLLVEKDGYLGPRMVDLSNGISKLVCDVAIYSQPAPVIDLELASESGGPLKIDFVPSVADSPTPVSLPRHVVFPVLCSRQNKIELPRGLADNVGSAEIRVVRAGQLLGVLLRGRWPSETTEPRVPSSAPSPKWIARLVETQGGGNGYLTLDAVIEASQ
jgi:hypothetical protein